MENIIYLHGKNYPEDRASIESSIKQGPVFMLDEPQTELSQYIDWLRECGLNSRILNKLKICREFPFGGDVTLISGDGIKLSKPCSMGELLKQLQPGTNFRLMIEDNSRRLLENIVQQMTNINYPLTEVDVKLRSEYKDAAKAALVPWEILDPVKALIAPAKDDFLALVPQARELGYPEYGKVHGLGHIYRVLLLSLIYYYNAGDSLSPEDKNILIYFSLLHDIGRTNDWKDDSHGEKSLEKIKEKPIEIKGVNLTEEGKAIASLAIRCHSISDTKGEEQIQSEMTEEHSRDRALKLYRICKDMDGLDRMRLGKRGLNTSQLRTDYAKSMVDTACIIYNDHLARQLSERIPKLRVERANIINVTADAIVLPADETLTCTTEEGAFGAIFKAVGKEKLEQACKEVLRVQGKESCAIGDAVVTPAFDLDADWIIHAVVPRWGGGEYEECSKLCSAYLSALALADCLKCSSIAFPLLASGRKNFSKKLAIQVAVECFNKVQGENLKKIILVVYDDDSVDSAKQLEYKVHETYSGPGKKHDNHYVGAQITERVKVAMKWLADPKTQEIIKTYAGYAMQDLVRRGLLKY